MMAIISISQKMLSNWFFGENWPL